jgi:NAD(P)H-dependent FMN reductase
LLSVPAAKIKLAIVVGSHRQGSQSIKVGRFVERTIKAHVSNADVYLLELAAHPLPFWDEGFRRGEEPWNSTWGPVAEELRASAALVVVSPEWSGMVPAALKNFFLLAGTAEIGHKPALIVGVSHSRGGAYPVAELRSSSYKNNHVCYIPEHVIVRDVKNVLNDPQTPVSADDHYLRERMAYAIRVLSAYAQALRSVRESGVLDHQTFPFGM